jgi:signal transduction histidine kinase
MDRDTEAAATPPSGLRTEHELPRDRSSSLAAIPARSIQFFEATHAIFATRNVEQLPQVIVEAAAKVMDAEAVSLLLPSGDGTLYVAHASGLPPGVRESTRVTIGTGIAGQVAASHKPVVLNGPIPGGHGRSKSSIVFPLVAGERLAGVLTFNRSAVERSFAEDDLGAVSVLASLVLLALENSRLMRQAALSEKLAAVGQLVAGIAHEINTPVQFIGDSLHFLREAVADLGRVVDAYRAVNALAEAGDNGALLPGAFAQAQSVCEEVEINYLQAETPKAVERSLEGVRRVSEIVQAVKAFGRVEQREKTEANINQLIETTAVVARAEYRHVADLKLELGEVGTILCHPGDLNQVLLNLVVNAAHAVADVVKTSGGRGLITVRTTRHAGDIIITISDTGTGIPTALRDKIFEPFFTTKEVGKGTGLGLAIARTIVEDKHAGRLSFESEIGHGTTFHIRLPIVDAVE